MHDSSGSSQSESKISGWDSDSQIPKWGPEAQGSQPNPSLSAISEDSWIAIAQQALAHAACVSVSGDDGECEFLLHVYLYQSSLYLRDQALLTGELY